jgi:hypothetical protein
MSISALTRAYNGISHQIVTPVEVKNPLTDIPFTTFAIWDTGATGTVITEHAALQLGLISIGWTNVAGVHDTKAVKRYFVNITLNNKNVSLNVPVTECSSLSPDNSIGVLIGMDIITKGDFAITNYQGKTVMSFRIPSIQQIDFVKGIQQSKPVVNAKIPSRNDPCTCNSGKKFKNCCGKIP